MFELREAREQLERYEDVFCEIVEEASMSPEATATQLYRAVKRCGELAANVVHRANVCESTIRSVGGLVLDIDCVPCTDKTITCVFCWRDRCTHQLQFKHYEGRTSTLGVHDTCAEAQKGGVWAPYPNRETSERDESEEA